MAHKNKSADRELHRSRGFVDRLVEAVKVSHKEDGQADSRHCPCSSMFSLSVYVEALLLMLKTGVLTKEWTAHKTQTGCPHGLHGEKGLPLMFSVALSNKKSTFSLIISSDHATTNVNYYKILSLEHCRNAVH
ncbi:uncharacterized protein PHALS_06165 [Plasmopara halstedii]|uniref:Uncharacterized protein n=1 Tax=Plasmopara halstedii TaxID=4781 RepID=A0A0N7L7Y1_PLAHL|nr:uncharacterized protein PHALS_06165 [Plasmopara halstedii]CEG48339.1 hypothetical protein PHALS_06165 [Plasmopara halstedii]|eukprot:XP_024584708.1 hypothetical protein PHALS_06165 [Plasmopara halstedii]